MVAERCAQEDPQQCDSAASDEHGRRGGGISDRSATIEAGSMFAEPPLAASRTGCRRKTRPDALCFASWAADAASCILAPPDGQGLC